MSRFILVGGVDSERQAFGGILDIEQSSTDEHYLDLVRAITNVLANPRTMDCEISFECIGETRSFYSTFPFNGAIEAEATIWMCED